MSNPAFPQKKEGQLNIYFHVSENSGVGYYREYLPAWILREKKLANVMINDFRWGEGNQLEPTMEVLFEIANWADIIVVGRRDMAGFYAQWGGIKEFFNIPIVMDTDDNVQHVRPHNPGYQGYHPGSEALTWNRYAINKVIDALTVSTEDLKDFYKKDIPRIYTLPNNLDVKEWNKHPKKEYNDGFIRFGFIGSAAHSDGIQLIKKPVIEILKKYPQTKFLISHIFMPQFNDAPKEVKDRIEATPWVKLEEWPKGLKEIGLDIGLAPLTDNLFNRGKSNLRWMEYSLAGAAPIISPVKPYLCVRDGETGIFAKERNDWFKSIENLIVDKDLRYNISNKAYEEVSQKYDVNKNIGLWAKTYQEIHDKYHEFFGPKKTFLKTSKKGEYRLLKNR